ncbi:hypothetical protein [uncultured Paludibaculum sp.]|uniref:hypothetical protein n=1 Tax=uncultured Paludibaculum sp. TaxID=1765020 RepID=UPI002AAC1441|nr:hypothetical protein [uncultured Paludibaculum sp.]
MRFALVVLLAGCAAAQQPDVELQLAVAGEMRPFRVGEAIPVTLDFTTTGLGVFRVDTDIRLRHLQPHGADVFSATPAEGWRDPMEHLPWKWDSGRMGSGPPHATLDSLHPVRIERDLNEFLVFSRPGRYTLKAVSTRVERLKLESNAIFLEIVARDDVWTARQFAEARAVLEEGAPEKQPEGVIHTDKENAQVDAVRRLRYLDTQAASEYLASLYGTGRRSDYEIGTALHASAFPDAEAEVLTRRMADPKLGITQDYLVALDMLRARAVRRQRGRDLTQEEWSALTESVRKSVMEAAGQKSPQAKAETYFYLFATESRPVSPELADRLIDALPGAPDFVLYVVLETNWAKIRNARSRLEPILKQAAARSSTPAGMNVSGLALRRLAELNTAAAEEIAHDKLAAGNSFADDPRLLEFSLPSSPALDRALLSQYKDGKPVEARIARFASDAVKDEVWQAFDARTAARAEGSPVCVTPVFAYFFRVDAEAATRRLAELRKNAQGPCAVLQIPGLEKQLMSPGLERQLTRDARSGDGPVRETAYRALSEAGSATALGPLVEALSEGEGAKDNEVFAILNGKRWFVTAEAYAVLKSACSPDRSCSAVERLEKESRPPYALSSWDVNEAAGVFLVNHMFENLAAFGAFLEQFPQGTEFRWRTGQAAIRQEEVERRRAVGLLLAEHGMRLVD